MKLLEEMFKAVIIQRKYLLWIERFHLEIQSEPISLGIELHLSTRKNVDPFVQMLSTFF